MKNQKYVIYGAGNIGARALTFLGRENVKFFIDNNECKQKQLYHGIEVLGFNAIVEKLSGLIIVVSVSEKYTNEIVSQLREHKIDSYITFNELKFNITKEKIRCRTDYIDTYNRAVEWIYKHSYEGKGIINNTGLDKPYPEVTGYFIPTLIKWGHKELALKYARWLCSIQHSNGSWYDTEDIYPYIFDTAQVLKGLLAVRKYLPEVDSAIIKGCEWILDNMEWNGRLKSPIDDIWGDGKTLSELIHLYCVSPLFEVASIFSREDIMIKAQKIKEYYISEYRDNILNFGLLSHFYAYVIEALVDLDEVELAKIAMRNIELIQKENGEIPGYIDVDWVCSTGLFQLSLIWFKLGNMKCGYKTFCYACKLQNSTGGWYGSYLSSYNPNEQNTYFPYDEISWANKYFLDALYYKIQLEFESQSDIFSDTISKEDGRYKCIEDIVSQNCQNRNIKVLDVGCGKGRYIKNLIEDFAQNEYYVSDISNKVMDYIIDDRVVKKPGTMTDIMYDNKMFDVVYTCEALEHAIDINAAVRELCRVTKKGGTVAIIDKNSDMLGYFDIEEWEQWFDEDVLKKILLKYCEDVRILKDVSFDSHSSNGLFYCWTGKVK